MAERRPKRFPIWSEPETAVAALVLIAGAVLVVLELAFNLIGAAQ